MGEAAIVNLAFGVTFAIIVWYAGRLHLRYRRLIRDLDQNRD